MDLATIGAAAGGALAALFGGFIKAKVWGSSAKVDAVANEAEASVIATLRAEVDRMSARLANLETRCDNQARRIWELETELRRHGIEVPA